MAKSEGESRPELRVNQQMAALKAEHSRLRSLRHSMDDALVELVGRQQKLDSIADEGNAELAAKYNL